MPYKSLQHVAEKSGYPVGAFLFVQRGLDFTVRRTHGESTARAALIDTEEHSSRHVSGQQLCIGLRDFARREYGLLARGVLARWRIHQSEDFGWIVFAMVDAELMHKTQEDTIEDFVDVFSFDKAFDDALMLSENP